MKIFINVLDLIQNRLVKIVHIIPFDGIGGVERAARTMDGVSNEILDFKVQTIFPKTEACRFLHLWNPWYFISTLIILKKQAPDILIVSLWRSYIVGCLAKFIVPKAQLVVFLHSAKHAHFIDKLFTITASRISNCMWADSNETMKSRLTNTTVTNSRIISFVTERILPNSLDEKSAPLPAFIFWGRLHSDKGLLEAIRLFNTIHNQFSNATFTIIGPDDGIRDELLAEIKQLRLDSAIQLLGAMPFDQIKEESKHAYFYLQTSKLEGMAMSVVEAMQLGLVPVVSPVGEIANYCSQSFNSIIVLDANQAVENVIGLLNNKEQYLKIRLNAIATWSDKPIYNDDVIRACLELLT